MTESDLPPARERSRIADLGVLRSRVGRRILGLFLLAAVLPVALAGWIGYSAFQSAARQLQSRLTSQVTHHVALQVLARLIEAKHLLADWSSLSHIEAHGQIDPVEEEVAHAADRHHLPGLGRVFTAAARLDLRGSVLWAHGDLGRAVSEWVRLSAALPPRPRMLVHRQGVGEVPVFLLNLPALPDRPARAVLAMQVRGGTWLAELDPLYLWTPVQDAAQAASWSVTDDQGRILHEAMPAGSPAPASGEVSVNRWQLFLGGEFSAPDWVFTQRNETPVTVIGGLPMGNWLAQGAAATLLVVAFLSLIQIRRTLVPLERLRQGTGRLARRETGVRVEVDSADEFGELAAAFNDMGRRIEQQFDALGTLARLDRMILDGEPEPGLIAHVLQAIGQRLPQAVVVLLRLDPQHPLLLCVHRSGPAGQAPARFDITPRQARLLGAWRRGDAGLESRQLQALPWGELLGHDEPVSLLCLPVRWARQTEALIVIGSPEGVAIEAETQRFLHELRDHLAVAMGARQREGELERRASHDMLTGLCNRHGLHEHLARLLGEECTPAVFYIDLDEFKQVNDTLGHDAGDELLRQAGERLRNGLSGDVLISRLGGDEFVVVLPHVGVHQVDVCTALAQRICHLLALPFPLRGERLQLGASVGVALAALHGKTREELLRHADIAMYEAKRAGRGRHALFEAPLDARVLSRSRLLADLRQAVERREFVLHYQPRVDSRSGRMVSAEALVRWQHPVHGLRMPGTFIELAEESGLIEAIGTQVLDQACAQMAVWRKEGLPLARLSVNVSPLQLQSGHLLRHVRTALDAHGLPASALELEVTESLLVGEARAVNAQLDELRRWGVTVALDDFGTGYSSMATLRQLPIDVMKVDRAFVKDLGSDDTALAITRAIVALAGSLGLHTVAEGMETREQADMLRVIGVDELQGYLFSQPVPAGPLADLVRRAVERPALVA